MSHRVLIGGLLAVLAVAAVSGQQAPQPQRAATPAAPSTNAAPQRAVSTATASAVTTRGRRRAVSRWTNRPSRLADHADVAEKVAPKLRAGMMPPLRSPRAADALDGLIGWIEDELDRHAVAT
jgi:hypothetical protein